MTSRTVMETEPIRADGTIARRLGHWTSARHLDVLASRASVQGCFPTIDDPSR